MLLTTSQVAERLQVSIKTVRRLEARGELAGIRIGPRALRFDPSEVDRFLADSTREAS